jgi:hypothetical protein
VTAPGRLLPDEVFQRVLRQVGNPHDARNRINEGVCLGDIKIYVNGVQVDAGYFETNYSLVLGYFDDDQRLILKKSPDGHYHALVWPTKPLTDPTGAWELDEDDIEQKLESLDSSPGQTGGNRGAKVKFDWDAVVAEFVRHMHTSGLPPDDKAEANRLFRWCLDHFRDGECPTEGTLRKKIGSWLRPLRSRRT